LIVRIASPLYYLFNHLAEPIILWELLGRDA
jgi:hypothetical protein